MIVRNSLTRRPEAKEKESFENQSNLVKFSGNFSEDMKLLVEGFISLDFPPLAGKMKSCLCLSSMLLRPLLLSCSSRVQLCATPWTAAHQAPPSGRFSRQENKSTGVGCHCLLCEFHELLRNGCFFALEYSPQNSMKIF